MALADGFLSNETRKRSQPNKKKTKRENATTRQEKAGRIRQRTERAE